MHESWGLHVSEGPTGKEAMTWLLTPREAGEVNISEPSPTHVLGCEWTARPWASPGPACLPLSLSLLEPPAHPV